MAGGIFKHVPRGLRRPLGIAALLGLLFVARRAERQLRGGVFEGQLEELVAGEAPEGDTAADPPAPPAAVTTTPSAAVFPEYPAPATRVIKNDGACTGWCGADVFIAAGEADDGCSCDARVCKVPGATHPCCAGIETACPAVAAPPAEHYAATLAYPVVHSGPQRTVLDAVSIVFPGVAIRSVR